MKNQFRTWSDVAVFLAVARAGSTLAASKDLGMSQNTVSRRIDELEARLGLVLFNRDTRGFRLTPEGKTLLVPAQDLESAAGNFGRAAEALKPHSQDPIRLTAAEANFTEWFAAILAEFTDSNPGVRLDLQATDAAVDLMAGEADVGIRHIHDVDPRLVARKIMGFNFTVFAAENYPNPPKTIHDVLRHPLILSQSTSNVFRFYPELQSHPNVRSTGDTVRAAVAAVRSGMGVAAIPAILGDGEKGLKRCFDPHPDSFVPTWILARPEAYRRREVKRLVDLLEMRSVEHYRNSNYGDLVTFFD